MISVVIPTYNCVKYISEAIESVLAQTYSDNEIIIIDDGSIDNTEQVLQRFVDGKKIRVFFQKNNGPSAARNLGIKVSKGEYIAFLDADDLWVNNKLEKTINFIKNNNFDWACTSMIKIKENGDKFVKRISDDSFALNFETKEVKQLTKGIFFFSSLAVQVQTVIVKKECFEKVGLFDESFCICEDSDLWLRFEEAGLRGGYLDEPLTVYRYNEDGLTKGGRIDTLEEGSKVARKHAYLLGINNKFIRNSYADYLWQVADLYLMNKKYFKTTKYILKSLYYNPLNVARGLRKLIGQSNPILWKK